MMGMDLESEMRGREGDVDGLFMLEATRQIDELQGCRT